MPPQVGKARDGSRPVPQTTCEGVQEVNSTQVEKQSGEKQKEARNETSPPRQATAKEKSDKQWDAATGADHKRRELDQKMNVIRGTSGDDKVHISKADGLAGKLGIYEINVNGKQQYLTEKQLSKTQIKTGAGNDRVVVDSNIKQGVNVDGGSGNDFIVGGSGADRISGGKGNDRIFGRGGRDQLYGDQGNDTIRGGKGDDYIEGGKGNDYIDGGKGQDQNIGGQGFDYVKSDRADLFAKSKKK